jgi:hypothetical protein
MKIKMTITLITLVITVIYFIFFRIPEVMLFQQTDTYTDIVAKNFPLTKYGKIKWWNENKLFLKNKYQTPKPDQHGNYNIVIWDGGSGFKKMPVGSTLFSLDTNDLYCFSVIDSDKNCIEKNIFMEIENWKNGQTMIRIGNDEIIQYPYIK